MVRIGSPSGGSILITSAPQSARTPPAPGPATHNPSSTTRTPDSIASAPSRAVEAHHLLYRRLHQRGVGAEAVLLLRTANEVQRAAGDEVGGGLVPGEQQQRAGTDHLRRVERLARVARLDQRRDQVGAGLAL